MRKIECQKKKIECNDVCFKFKCTMLDTFVDRGRYPCPVKFPALKFYKVDRLTVSLKPPFSPWAIESATTTIQTHPYRKNPDPCRRICQRSDRSCRTGWAGTLVRIGSRPRHELSTLAPRQLSSGTLLCTCWGELGLESEWDSLARGVTCAYSTTIFFMSIGNHLISEYVRISSHFFNKINYIKLEEY